MKMHIPGSKPAIGLGLLENWVEDGMEREEMQCMKCIRYFKHFKIYVPLLRRPTELYAFVIVLDVELSWRSYLEEGKIIWEGKENSILWWLCVLEGKDKIEDDAKSEQHFQNVEILPWFRVPKWTSGVTWET